MYGLQRLPTSHPLHTGVRRFLPIVRVLAWGSDAADRYAAIRLQTPVRRSVNST
jgi:hypothetical protein